MSAPAAGGHAPCPICGGPVERRPSERPHEWRKRKSCSPECKRDLNSVSLKCDPAKRGDHPPCPICLGPVPRHPGEERNLWFVRVTCGAVCLGKIRAQQMRETNTAYKIGRRAAAMDHIHPPCKVCGGPVEIRAAEAPYYWRARKTCSVLCFSKLRAGPRGEYQSRATECSIGDPEPHQVARSGKRHKPDGAPIFETVEQALARGLTIQRVAPATLIPSQTAVMSRAGIIGNGRVL